ncbi:hypothetical protein IG193_03565 [Infirmifilum lucidum]|uniref:Uncharacterized protein n=1 Tax=Infirmifilum lucidum TaxID=2776706 RepID=A0A7L9FI85_9CREN|nr:hypothetical protein [Infirmifilum lucidum]QOJ79548.1 hypothetical protein IG193_03565 [Infirmifilum lucidum]
MPLKLDQAEKRLLYLLYSYGKAVSRKRIHELVFKLQEEYGVQLGFKFSGHPPISKELDEKLQDLVNKGLVKVMYSVGGSYLSLYKPYYKLTERGVRLAKRGEFSKTDKESIDRMVSDIRGAEKTRASGVAGQQ